MHHISWAKFLLLFIATTAAGVVSIFLFVALVNPYANLAISLPMEHHRVTGNERYAFPGLIRGSSYDSAVFGTSTVMLLHPHELNKELGGRFANLSMGSATAWEQLEILKLFSRKNRTRRIIIAIDAVWCNPRENAARLTFRPFPPWMYDDNPWNDYLHLLNERAVMHALRRAAISVGLASPPYGPDGYFRFVPDQSEYDLVKARQSIYGDRANSLPSHQSDIERLRASQKPPSRDPYPDIASLFRELDLLPRETSIVLMFAPYHASLFATPESWPIVTDCKHAVVRSAAARGGVTVVDFMRPTPLTLHDSNYWDPLHYTVDQASNIVRALSAAVAGLDRGELVEVLHRPGWVYDGSLR